MSSAAASRFPLRFSIVFSIVFLALYKPLFRHLEDLWQDKMFETHAARLPAGDPRIVIVAMDEDTGKKYGYPLPRGVQARALDKLNALGVKAVAYDVMFLEPREGDAELAAATRRFGHVVHLFLTQTKNTPGGQLVSIQEPVAVLGRAAEHLGYPNVDPVLDADGHVRRAILFDSRTHDPRDPSLPAPTIEAALLASYEGKPLKDLAERFAKPEPALLTVNFRVPREQLAHPYRDEKRSGIQGLPTIVSSYRMISMLDVLDGTLTPEQRTALKGSLAFIGSTTLGYFDHYPTPFTAEAPGVEFHANVIDNVLHDDFLRREPTAAVALTILAMIWLPLVLMRLSPVEGAAGALAALAGWAVLCWWEFPRGRSLAAVGPMTALFTAYLVQTVHRVLTEGQEKRFIKNLFGQFVAPEVVEDLAKDPGKVKLGGEKRDLTIFFLDIAHFTSISEKMSPERLIEFLNRYLSALSQVVQEKQGVVDKYIGDCIMAFWNAPIEVRDHRVQACLAAIDCQKTMDELNKTLDGSMPETPAIRIGLNSGQATVGLTGSQKKLQYTVIGDEVNLASRLEGANKFFGSRILASESTFEGARDAVVGRELGRVRVVGKETPIKVYELLGRKGQLSPEWTRALPHYERGIELFLEQKWGEAALAFEEVVKIFPKDGPANLYLSTTRDYAAIAPAEGWDVFNLTAK